MDCNIYIGELRRKLAEDRRAVIEALRLSQRRSYFKDNAWIIRDG